MFSRINPVFLLLILENEVTTVKIYFKSKIAKLLIYNYHTLCIVVAEMIENDRCVVELGTGKTEFQ